jgi:hypothetical protein
MDEEKCTDMMNIFIKFFNHANGTDYHLFQGIEYLDETNDMIEEFRAHIYDFNDSDEGTRHIYGTTEIDPNNFESIYELSVNGDVKCYCQMLIPLINFIIQYVNDSRWNIRLIENEEN